ncbi:MAG: LamG domain-containing protein [Planctomycetes bacterium]|nr:LamG domain-containing protein [Planctomycetota bacterium]
MQSRIVKIAAGVMVVAAVLVGLNVIDTGGSVVWGSVLQKVNESAAFAYRMRLTMLGVPDSRSTAEIESQVRVDTEVGIHIISSMKGAPYSESFVSIPKETGVTLLPAKKAYLRQKMTGGMLEKMGTQHGDPKQLVARFLEYPHTKLGRRTLDGIEVEGLECRDPGVAAGVFGGVAGQTIENVVGRLWADPRTNLPVKLELEAFSADGRKAAEMVQYEYDWAPRIDPAEFEPVIPADYKLVADVEVSFDEKGLVEGLRFFAEYTDGKYPTELSAMVVGRELRLALNAKFGPNPPWPPKPGDENRIFALGTVAPFYAFLAAENRDPAYHGDKVTAEFPQAVLMRWRLDNGNYRVILGDLTLPEVTAEELKRLEAAPLNLQSKAIQPQPQDGSVGTAIEKLELSWMPGAQATGHKVYFGTNAEGLTLFAEVEGATSVVTPALQRGASYSWRVDEVQPDGSVVTGEVWTFRPGGLVGWWNFDEGAGTRAADSSGHGLHGTLVGGPAWVDGVIGKALELDGADDYVDLGNDPAFAITGPITICAWIKVKTFDKEWQAIVTKGDSSWRLQRNWGQNTLEFACTGVPMPGTLLGSLFGTVNVDDGRWHHVAAVYDGTRGSLYTDGRLDISVEVAGTLRTAHDKVFVGANDEKPGRNWNGAIDDVRIYSYGLTAQEVAQIYEARSR